MENKSEIMGSGDSAMEQNAQAIKTAQDKLEELRVRAERGEQVNDREVKELHERIRAMKQDMEKMSAGGI